MTKIRYIGRHTKGVTVDVIGSAVILPGDEVEAPDAVAKSLIAQGAFEKIETKTASKKAAKDES